MPPKGKFESGYEEVLRIQRLGSLPVVAVVHGPVAEGMSLEQYASDTIKFLTSKDWVTTHPTTNIVLHRMVRLEDGSPAWELVLTGVSLTRFPSREEVGRQLEQRDVQVKVLHVVRGATCFMVEGLTTIDLFNMQEAQIDEVLYSFRLE